MVRKINRKSFFSLSHVILLRFHLLHTAAGKISNVQCVRHVDIWTVWRCKPEPVQLDTAILRNFEPTLVIWLIDISWISNYNEVISWLANVFIRCNIYLIQSLRLSSSGLIYKKNFNYSDLSLSVRHDMNTGSFRIKGHIYYFSQGCIFQRIVVIQAPKHSAMNAILLETGGQRHNILLAHL